jgi:hypothetical protein
MLLVIALVAAWLAVLASVIAMFRVAALGDEVASGRRQRERGRDQEAGDGGIPSPASRLHRRLYAVNRS